MVDRVTDIGIGYEATCLRNHWLKNEEDHNDGSIDVLLSQSAGQCHCAAYDFPCIKVLGLMEVMQVINKNIGTGDRAHHRKGCVMGQDVVCGCEGYHGIHFSASKKMSQLKWSTPWNRAESILPTSHPHQRNNGMGEGLWKRERKCTARKRDESMG